MDNMYELKEENWIVNTYDVCLTEAVEELEHEIFISGHTTAVCFGDGSNYKFFVDTIPQQKKCLIDNIRDTSLRDADVDWLPSKERPMELLWQ